MIVYTQYSVHIGPIYEFSQYRSRLFYLDPVRLATVITKVDEQMIPPRYATAVGELCKYRLFQVVALELIADARFRLLDNMLVCLHPCALHD